MIELFRKALSLRRYTLRVQLTLLYSGLGIALCAAVLGAAGLLVRRGSSANAGLPGVIASSQNGTVRHFEVGAAVIFVVAALVALALGWWIAGRLLRPLRTITATARDISATNLHQRLGLDGPDDELTELGKTLDDLFERLEASFEAQRHFVANASHELRTPLAGQRTLLQVALADPEASVEGFRAACEEAVQLGEHQERLIDALLTLATTERGVEQWRPFDLGQIAETVLVGHEQAAQGRGIHISASLVAARASGDPMLVERLVSGW
jgi:signal transduction histidine kinase